VLCCKDKGEWRYSCTILDLGTRLEVSGQLHTLATLPQGKDPRFPLDRTLGESQSWSGHCGQEKNLDSARNQTPAIQPVAILTELSCVNILMSAQN
jgi:hypothetical protein